MRELTGETMAREKILIVDDEENILELLEYNLKRNGFRSSSVMSGEDAVIKAKEIMPDLIILDLMLPGMDGLEVCKTLKKDIKTSSIPVIMLTAKSEEADIVTGLEIGADDYVCKPFSPRVLIARVKAVLRKTNGNSADDSTPLRLKDLVVHPGRFEVLLHGKRIDLTYTEFEVLLVLLSRKGWVFSRYQIIDAIRGSDYIVTDRSVDVQITGLRKKLGSYGKYVETVRGVGYRIRE